MVGDREVAGRERVDIRAAVDVEDSLALDALKVMVMGEVGGLVSRRLAGQVYDLEVAFFDVLLEVPVNGRNPDSIDEGLGALVDFLGRQGPISPLEDSLYRISLFRLSGHTRLEGWLSAARWDVELLVLRPGCHCREDVIIRLAFRTAIR